MRCATVGGPLVAQSVQRAAAQRQSLSPTARRVIVKERRLEPTSADIIRVVVTMSKQCECHPWSEDDERIWKLVKSQPRTRQQWAALHDAIESYRRLLIEDYKRAALAAAPQGGSTT